MGLPFRTTGLDMHINRVLITDKATAEIGLAWCHKTGSVPHLPVTLWEADNGQVCTCVCLRPDRYSPAVQSSRAGRSLVWEWKEMAASVPCKRLSNMAGASVVLYRPLSSFPSLRQ